MAYALTKAQSESLEAIHHKNVPFISLITLQRGMPYCSMLYCTNIDSLASRREELSRDFFHNILDPASCLHSLLPPPRSTAITSRLRSSQTFPKVHTVPTATVPSSNMLSTIISKSSCSIITSAFASHLYYYPLHYVPCTFIFAFSFLFLISSQSLLEFYFFIVV